MIDFILYILAGAGVGFAVGLTGVGGGSLMTPLLLTFGFPFNVAIGTDLLYASITKAGGAISHRQQGNVDWCLVKRLAIGSVPGSLITAWLLSSVFSDASHYEPLLTTSLGVMLILTSAVLLLKSNIQSISDKPSFWVSQAPIITVLCGGLLGVVVTLSSVGAGAFCAALLMILYPTIRAKRVVGTDIAHAVPLTLVAGLGHLFLLGNVDFKLLFCLLIGSLPAINIGSRLATHLPNKMLQPMLAALLMIIGFKFAFFN